MGSGFGTRRRYCRRRCGRCGRRRRRKVFLDRLDFLQRRLVAGRQAQRRREVLFGRRPLAELAIRDAAPIVRLGVRRVERDRLDRRPGGVTTNGWDIELITRKKTIQSGADFERSR